MRNFTVKESRIGSAVREIIRYRQKKFTTLYIRIKINQSMDKNDIHKYRGIKFFEQSDLKIRCSVDRKKAYKNKSYYERII